MKTKLNWLAFKVSDDYRLCPCRAESRQDALRYGMEHFPDRKLVAVYSEGLSLNVEQMLELAKVAPPPGSLMSRHPKE